MTAITTSSSMRVNPNGRRRSVRWSEANGNMVSLRPADPVTAARAPHGKVPSEPNRWPHGIREKWRKSDETPRIFGGVSSDHHRKGKPSPFKAPRRWPRSSGSRGGNFRLLHRLLAQVARLMGINDLRVATRAVVEAARESLVIGAG
jgi:hypothetical protein